MSIELSEMIEGIDPSSTVLFFGAGSSIPSGAPSVDKVIASVSLKFNIDAERTSRINLDANR
jgi:hypothetical protein